MIDQILDSFRRTSESSMQAQQELWKRWSQQWTAAPPAPMGLSAEWAPNLQKRCTELALELLNKHRESLDASYKSSLDLVEQAARLADVKSAEDYSRVVGDLWHKLFETFKGQSEDQIRDLQSWAEKSFDLARRPS